MNTLTFLRRPLARDTDADGLDVLRTKALLQTLGHYHPPDWGLTAIPDVALIDAIRAFQKERGLRTDGVMKPGGDTEIALAHAMDGRRTRAAYRTMGEALREQGRNGDTILAHITPAEARLLDAVTDGGSINPTTGLPEFWHDYEAEAYGVTNNPGDNFGADWDDGGGDNDSGRDEVKTLGGRETLGGSSSPQATPTPPIPSGITGFTKPNTVPSRPRSTRAGPGQGMPAGSAATIQAFLEPSQKPRNIEGMNRKQNVTDYEFDAYRDIIKAAQKKTAPKKEPAETSRSLADKLSVFARAVAQPSAKSGLNVMAGINSGIGPAVNRTTDWQAYNRGMAAANSWVTPQELATPAGRLGRGVGNILAAIAGLTGVPGAGESAYKAYQAGQSYKAQRNAAAYDLSIGAVTGKLAATGGLLGKAVMNTGKRNLLDTRTFGLTDNLLAAGTKGAAISMKSGLDLLTAGTREERQIGKREQVNRKR